MRRYFGWKKTVALGVGGMLALLKNELASIPADGVSYTAMILVERVNALAAVCLGFQLLSPLSVLLRHQPRARRAGAHTRALIMGVCVIAVLTTAAVAAGGDVSEASRNYLAWNLSTTASIWAPLALLEVAEWARSQSWFRRLLRAGEGASAGMAGVRELRRRRHDPRWFSGTFFFIDALLLGSSLVESTHRRFTIRLRDELGTILLGAARSGKSVRFLWLWAATNNQINIFVDPKAHATRLLSGRLSDPEARQRFGETVLDTDGITRAKERLKDGRVHGWDPYGLGHPYIGASINVVLLVDPASPYCRVMLAAISQSVVIPTGDEQHWVAELTRLVIEGFVAHLRTARPRDQQCLGFLADLFAGLERVEGDIRLRQDLHPIETLLDEMRQNDAAGGICLQAAQAFASLEGREVGIVVSEIARSLKTFSDPVIRAATSGEGIDLRAVVESPTPVTLFLSLPFGAIIEHNRVLRVIVSCLLRLTEQRRDKSRAVHFFLDEFAAYAKNLSAVRDATVTLGGAGARLHIALQFYAQLRACLGADAADAFEASSNVVAAGLGDRATNEYISQRFGRHTIKKWRGWWPCRRLVREQEVPVLDTETTARLLDRKSRLGACIPGAGSPFLFETLAYRPLSLYGTRMGVWELPEDAFDDHLLEEERGGTTHAARPTLRLNPAIGHPPVQRTERPPQLRLSRRTD